jgi:hypothetical protein
MSVFMLFFLEIIQLLVVEAKRHYHQYLDTLDKGWSPLPDMTVQEMFLAIILQMRHDKGYNESIMEYSGTVQYTLSQKDKMRQILSHSEIPTLH